ncbi:MAG: M16 family metallopeptidase [Ardenticatenaceae bacterium]
MINLTSHATATSHARSSLPSAENIALRQLKNGLLLAARENFTTPAVIMRGRLGVGAMDESPEKSGLASLTASLLSRGTERRDYDTINEAIEGVGASAGFSGGTHTSGAWGKCLAEDFSDILNLVTEMMRYPTFPEDHLERVRAQRVTGLREQQNNTRAMADMLFYESAYPASHPYHHNSSGTPESVESLTRDELFEFHRANYGPAGGIFLVVGALPQEEALDLLEAALGDWEPLAGREMSREVPAVAWPEKAISQFYEMPSKTQNDIYYGLPTIPMTHPDFMALRLANTIMGVFGMMGRIGKSVRDHQGLAYYARSSLHASRGPSAWVATAGVSPDKVSQAVDSIRYEWVRMGKELVGEEEINNSKSLLTGSVPLQLETNNGVSQTILNMLSYDLGLDYLLRYNERINAITAEDIRRMSKQYFDPECAVLAVAGPATK